MTLSAVVAAIPSALAPATHFLAVRDRMAGDTP